MEKDAFIGIGSNLGDKLENCLKAISFVDHVPGCRVRARSDFFRTAPVGVDNPEWYVNGVIDVITDRSAHALLEALLAIEAQMGRVRRKKWDSRIIDLDILLYGQDVIQETTLEIPHPLMHVRRFVLVPMTQLAPGLVHPVLGKTMSQLLDQCPREGQDVVPMGDA
jgi:2-amino-4-hydroxy-6-hydroxymethyldihydropteridine diphosphokinase